MFHKALFPLNFKESDTRIEEMLAFLRNFGTKHVVFLHVSSFGVGGSTKAERRLREVADIASQHGFEPRVLLRNGSAASEIVRVCGEEELDFICFSWKRKSWIQRSVLGSTSRDVIRLSDSPVFVKKRMPPSSDEGGMTVVYGTDFRATDANISPYLRFSGLTAKRLWLVHVGSRAPDPEAEHRRVQQVESNLARLSNEFADNYEEINEIATVGTPRREIVRHARRVGADLIVLGKSDKASAFAAVTGSTAEEVPYSARCSVLLVPRR
ncbi:MAG: universal stress protein [Spirochaetota bacterium]